MYWPVSTPRVFSLPSIPVSSFHAFDDSGLKGERYIVDATDPIVTVKFARSGSIVGVLTRTVLYVYQSKPFVPIAAVVRTETSLQNYGENINLLIRPDSQLFIVQTAASYFMTYAIIANSSERVDRFVFDNGSSITYVLPGPGEENGVFALGVKFRMVIKVDAGIECALALEDELLVMTTTPPATQLIRWVPDSKGGPQTRTQLFTHMDWYDCNERVVSVVYERAMGLYGWISQDGRGWAVVMNNPSNNTEKIEKPEKSEKSARLQIFNGFCLSEETDNTSTQAAVTADKKTSCSFLHKIAINSRFSLIGVALKGGLIQIYNVKDYSGHIPLLKKIPAPFTSFGDITVISWSPDGYALFVGYESGWALYSVYGTLQAHSSISEDFKGIREAWLDGIRDVAWSPNGDEILMIPNGSSEVCVMEFSRWSLSNTYNYDNLQRALLHTNEKLLLYRGHEQSDLTTISHEAILWQEIAIPYSYLTQNWPIQHTCISGDGRYLALSGKHGLAHYSVYSGRWKFFADERMESEFSMHGGMLWYDKVLIAAVTTDRNIHEIRAYSRDNELDDSLVLCSQAMPTSIILMSLVGDSLLVYGYNNTLYQFVIDQSAFQFSLELVGQVSFAGIVHAPARVRAINWILPEEQMKTGDPYNDVSLATVLFLIDGKLVMLYPIIQDELRYDMKVLRQNVEYYTIVSKGLLKNSIWAFDGTDVIVWLDVMLNLSKDDTVPEPIRIEVDFYPLSFLFEKGIIIGLESNVVRRRNVQFSYSTNTTRTHLFIHQLLRYYLSTGREADALKTAKSFQHLEYFGHALEMMLHNVLDEEADSPPPLEKALLPKVITFLRNFPEMLDVLVGCTRKTEVASWHVLFDIVGSPKDLFERCMSEGRLKTAGAYLLILHTMEQLKDSSSDMIRLFSAAVETGDWDLCKELARFLAALDDSGNTLRRALQSLNLMNSIDPVSSAKDDDLALTIKMADERAKSLHLPED
ncbi:RIC1-domain-containing protein [Lipomyces oligophaga]|uniref:RIC1-domain-containing protein n=1 Tax=Lipomyces oligophaga TaxID=45792 RepID=UPI0034CEB4B8